jgi:hypothetical protein
MKGVQVKTDKVSDTLGAISALSGKAVQVGYPRDGGRRKMSDDLSNASLAYLHEFGSAAKNIEARPFLIPGVRKAHDKIGSALESTIKNLFSPGALDKGLNIAGLAAQNSVKATITKGEGFKALSEETLKDRRSAGFKGTKPLIRTGQLRNAVTYVIKTARGK